MGAQPKVLSPLKKNLCLAVNSHVLVFNSCPINFGNLGKGKQIGTNSLVMVDSSVLIHKLKIERLDRTQGIALGYF